MNIAFVFPGQGSQSVGMLSDLAGGHPAIGETFAEASAELGFDLWALCRDGPQGRLDLTFNTQPAMLAADVAVWRAWSATGGPRPVIMAGHSLGEYAALVCAGVLELGNAVSLVADRGRYMQDAVPTGAGAIAAVIGADDDAVRALCRDAAEGDVLEAVNFNAPGQVAVAGTKAAVLRAVERAPAHGARRAIMLPVSVPVHSSLMAPAAQRLEQRLAGVPMHAPRIPVIHNWHLRAEQEPGAIRTALVRQLDAPVRWVDTVRQLAAYPAGAVVECGPGKVLAGLNRRIDRDLPVYALHDAAGFESALRALTQTAGTVESSGAG